jgi:hypothetical protein
VRETDLALQTGPDLRDGEDRGCVGRVDRGCEGVVEVYHFDQVIGGFALGGDWL